MTTLDNAMLAEVLKGFDKLAFVPMPGGQAEPVAGASPMTAGMADPMMDPSGGGGMPMDPAAGGMPMDPAAGGMPMGPEGMPPELAGLMGGGEPMPAEGQVTLTGPELIELIRVLQGGKSEGGEGLGSEKPKRKSGNAEVSEKLDAILAAIGGGAPAPVM